MQQNNLHFYFYSGTRAPQNLMTTVPEKLWPGAKVPYNLNINIREWTHMYMYSTMKKKVCTANTCIVMKTYLWIKHLNILSFLKRNKVSLIEEYKPRMCTIVWHVASVKFCYSLLLIYMDRYYISLYNMHKSSLHWAYAFVENRSNHLHTKLGEMIIYHELYLKS